MLVILAIQEAEIRRTAVQSQPGQIVPETLSGASFFLTPLLLLNLTGQQWEMQKGHKIDRELGPGVLGTWVELHNPHYFILFIYFVFFLYLYSLRPYSFTIL
jgi:hypothetical protein